MVSPGLEGLAKLLRKWRDRSAPSVETIRAGLDYMASTLHLPKDVRWEAVDAGGVPAEWISTPGVGQDKAIFHLHGGGWVAGSVKNSREFLGRLSRATKVKILSVDYRLAPEHPYPAAVDDCFAAYKWLLSTGIPFKNVIIVGESAGGNLAAVTLLKARNANLPLPVAGILISPGTDLGNIKGTLKSKATEDPFLSPAMVKVMVSNYITRLDQLQDPYVSPLYADLRGLPPLFVQVGTAEILFDHAPSFAEKAKVAGVNCEIDIIEGGIHTMALFPSMIPEANLAMNHIIQFISRFFQPT